MKKLTHHFRRPVAVLQKLSLSGSSVTLFSIAAFVLLNMLVSGLSYRIDLSQGKAYTLSPATKKIVHALDDVVTIKLYASSDLPTRLAPVRMSVVDFLNEYKREGGSRINVKIVDPKKDAAAMRETEELQIPELQFSQLENDKYQISSAFFALGVFYGNKKNVLPQVTDLSNLEYNITSFIYKLTKKELDRISIAGIDENAGSQNDPFGPFKNAISTQFLTSYVNPEAEDVKDLGKDAKALVLVSPSGKKWEDATVEKLKKYLDAKGKLVVLADGVWVNEDLTTAPAEHNLFALLRGEGIDLQKNLVLSTSAEFVNFGNNLYQYLSPYPFWVRTTSFNKKTGFFSNLTQLTFPWTSSLSMSGNKNGTVVVDAPKSSWQQQDTFELYPQKLTQPAAKDMKAFPLIGMATTLHGGTLIVIPSSRFLDARYLSQNSGNIEFVFNVLSNIVSGGALSGIRSRSLSFHQLPDLPDNQREAMKYAMIGLLPVLYGVFGALRLIRRK